MLIHDTILQYEAAGTLIGETEALNITSVRTFFFLYLVVYPFLSRFVSCVTQTVSSFFSRVPLPASSPLFCSPLSRCPSPLLPGSLPLLSTLSTFLYSSALLYSRGQGRKRRELVRYLHWTRGRIRRQYHLRAVRARVTRHVRRVRKRPRGDPLRRRLQQLRPPEHDAVVLTSKGLRGQCDIPHGFDTPLNPRVKSN